MVRTTALAAPCVALLVACVPVAPLPAESFGDRENLRAEAIAFIEVGKTTRAELLMRLGEADATALDSSWLLYRTREGLGGAVHILISGTGVPMGAIATQDFNFARLVVYFDVTGVVERVVPEGGHCTFIGRGRGPGSRPMQCPNIEGTDLPLVRGLR
jgi:hypothetical protein